LGASDASAAVAGLGLARTGGDVAGVVRVGVLTGAAGWVLLLAARRRRSTLVVRTAG
jgi:hypothetical protein